MHAIWAKSFAIIGVMVILPAFASAQDWVNLSKEAVEGDSGVGTKAIVRREILNIAESPARTKAGGTLTYNHPADLCETRDGALIMIWNGGQSEAESSNRVSFTGSTTHS